MADDDFEIVDNADDDFEIVSPETPITGIMGPAGDTGEAPPREAESHGRPVAAFVEGAASGMWGVPQLGAGLNTAIDVARHPSADVLDTYQAWRSKQLANSRELQKSNPVAYGAGSAVSGLGTALATAPLAAGNAAKQTLMNAFDAYSASANEGEGDLWGTLKNIAWGKVAQGAGRAAAKDVSGFGSVLQAPQVAKEAIAHRIGGTKIGQFMAETGDELSNRFKSERVKGLESTIAASENFQPSPVTKFDASKLTPDDAAAYRLALADTTGNANLTKGSWSVNKEALASGTGDDLAAMSRQANLDALRKYYPGKDLSKIDPADAWFEIAENPRLRMDEAINAKKGVVPPDDLMDLRAQRAAAKGTENAASQMANKNRTAELDYTFGRARDLSAEMQRAERLGAEDVAANASEQARLGQEAMAAREELQRIRTGNKAMSNVGGTLASAGAGYSAGGVPGAVMGALAARKIGAGSTVLNFIDAMGAAGQKLSRVASIAERLATRQDSVGRAAQWALSAPGEQALVRMAVLADLPEVQDEIGSE